MESAESFRGFTPRLSVDDAGQYELRATTGDVTDTTAIRAEPDGIPSFVRGSVYVEPDGTLDVTSAMA